MKEPVRCTCGSDASVSDNGIGIIAQLPWENVSYWVECIATQDCGRVGVSCTSPDAAVEAWDSDINAIKHHDALEAVLDAARAWHEADHSKKREAETYLIDAIEAEAGKEE